MEFLTDHIFGDIYRLVYQYFDQKHKEMHIVWNGFYIISLLQNKFTSFNCEFSYATFESPNHVFCPKWWL